MVLHEDVFGFFLPAYVGQGSPGQKKGKQRLTDKFPKMTKLETVWLRMALKLYRAYEPTAKDLRAADREVPSSWAIKCILALIAAK